jgi:hypothetical protein
MGMLIKLSCKKCSSQLLFPGDMEGDGATDLAENHNKLLKSSHYKMAHHSQRKSKSCQSARKRQVHLSQVYTTIHVAMLSNV